KWITSGSVKVVTGVFDTIVRAVMSTGVPPADQVEPDGAASDGCGVIVITMPSPGVFGTTVPGHCTDDVASAVVRPLPWFGIPVFAVGGTSGLEPCVQTVKWVTK